MGCSPGMRACPATCGHKQMVMGYREEYQRQNDALWERSGGYETEYLDNKRQLREAGTPLPQFKDWLKQNRRPVVDETTPILTEEQATIKQMAGIDWASNPVRGEVRDGASFLNWDNNRDANEGMLLATALNSDEGLQALRALELKEFYQPLHQDVGRAITWLADRDKPHDAAAVTTLLREHDRLPLELDPKVPLFEVDPDQYGLGAWQTYSPPAMMAPGFAQAVRSEYRSREMEAICTRGANAARAAIEYGDNGMVTRDLVGTVRMDMANELRVLPPMLDENLQPTTGHSPNNIDPELLSVAATAQPMQVIENWDRFPQPPVLSQAGREATSRG